MALLLPINDQDLQAFQKNSNWFVAWGAILVLLGVFAISVSMMTTLISVIILGALIFAGGVVTLIDTFTFWRGKASGFLLHLTMAILYLLVGAVLVFQPAVSSIYLTLILAVFYIFIGFTRITYSISLRAPRWGWNLFNGIICVLLGILIMAQLPASGLYIIGLFIGIDLIFSGWAYLMAGIAPRSN
jgi:uncharacterized membrane protein HdeD (DUF308 family)